MAQRESNLMPLLLVAAGVGLIAYTQMNQQPTFTPIQPGQGYGGYTNNTGAAVYLDAAGNIIDSLGNLIATIVSATNNGNNSDDTSYDSPYFDENDNITGNRVNASYFCQRPENRYSRKCNPTIIRAGLNPTMI